MDARRRPRLAGALDLRAARHAARRGHVLSAALASAPEAQRRRTILVVDDTPLLRDLAALFLARSGRVVTASSGEEALALANAIHPDLVFADLSMPGLDGAALCRELKRSPLHADVPVVLLVGADSAAERERAVRAGADDVIAKPVERLALLEVARRLLDRSDLRGQPRIPLEAPARVRRHTREWPCTARNLSRGGVFVESADLLPEAAEVELALVLPAPDTPFALASTAEVIWARPADADHYAGMGLRFLALDRATARRLADYVEERLPRPLAASGGPR